jgi:hypothetical protein
LKVNFLLELLFYDALNVKNGFLGEFNKSLLCKLDFDWFLVKLWKYLKFLDLEESFSILINNNKIKLNGRSKNRPKLIREKGLCYYDHRW